MTPWLFSDIWRAPWKNQVTSTNAFLRKWEKSFSMNFAERANINWTMYASAAFLTGRCGVRWSNWSSHFRRFANVVAQSQRRRFRAVNGVWDAVFRWILTARRIRLIDSKRIQRWRQQNGSGLPDRPLAGPSADNRHPSRKHVSHTRNCGGKLLPVCFRLGGKRSEWTGLI